MDRQITYVGATPSAKDALAGGQFAMIGLAKLAAAILGTSSIVNGFGCAPTSPNASLSVVVGAGEIYELESLEAQPISLLTADTAHQILKQGIVLDPTTLTFIAPQTVGYSQVFLIQAQYDDSDTNDLVLNYYNSANPLLPFYGPPVNGSGSGQKQSTIRAGKVAIETKAGTSQPSGSQINPTADPGWVPLYYVSLSNGDTSISAGQITTVSTAPFIPTTLPGVPAGVQSGQWTYGGLTQGTSTNFLATPFAIPAALQPGMGIVAKMHAAPGQNAALAIPGYGALPVVRRGGADTVGTEWAALDFVEFLYTGSSWQIHGMTQADIAFPPAPVIPPQTTYSAEIEGGLVLDGTAFKLGFQNLVEDDAPVALDTVAYRRAADGTHVTTNVSEFAAAILAYAPAPTVANSFGEFDMPAQISIGNNTVANFPLTGFTTPWGNGNANGFTFTQAGKFAITIQVSIGVSTTLNQLGGSASNARAYATASVSLNGNQILTSPLAGTASNYLATMTYNVTIARLFQIGDTLSITGVGTGDAFNAAGVYFLKPSFVAVTKLL